MRRSLIIVIAIICSFVTIVASLPTAKAPPASVQRPPITDAITPLTPQERAEWEIVKAEVLANNPDAVKQPPVMGTPNLEVLAHQELYARYLQRYGVPAPGCMSTRWMLYKLR